MMTGIKTRELGTRVISTTRPARVVLVAVTTVVSNVPVIASVGTLTVTVMSAVWLGSSVTEPGSGIVAPPAPAVAVDQPRDVLHVRLYVSLMLPVFKSV